MLRDRFNNPKLTASCLLIRWNYIPRLCYT